MPDIEIGETIEDAVEMTDFGRVAAGTAKQVVVQRIKEAEKEFVGCNYGTFKRAVADIVCSTLEELQTK